MSCFAFVCFILAVIIILEGLKPDTGCGTILLLIFFFWVIFASIGETSYNEGYEKGRQDYKEQIELIQGKENSLK